MKTKKVNRYYCDYCRKSGCAAGHMRRHESGCTMNPNRTCRVCGILEETQSPMPDLVACLPDHEAHREGPDEFGHEHYRITLTTAANEALSKLRELAHNCPACIMAAIRQAHIPVTMVTDFSWTDEMAGVWSELNASNAERY